MNAILSRMAAYLTCTVTLGGVELEVDYSVDDGCIYIDRILTARGDDITDLRDWLDAQDHLTNLVEMEQERR
jgi:hypothetical protein